MKIAYASTFDSQDIQNWSGTPYHMSRTFAENGTQVDYCGSLKRKLPAGFKAKQIWQKYICSQRESPRFNIHAAQHYSEQLKQKLERLPSTVILAPQINPIAYLDCKQPIVLWTDALYASLIGFYPAFANHSQHSIEQGNKITAECLARTQLAIFSSDWAARSAIELYGINKDKVKVVPFGANIQCHHTQQDILDMLTLRKQECITFLFLGKHWDRKGADIVFSVMEALHKTGLNIKLHFVGCMPPKRMKIPPYITCHGFISKRTLEGAEKINQLLRESHFLFVPSRAEAYGIVFCEANAFGLPCLTSYTGGIATVVRDNVNGMTFSLNATPEQYCDYILNLVNDYSKYEALALSAFNEYQTRLNWNVATKHVHQLMQEIV